MTRLELLDWLALEDESALGECDGPLLDQLLREGLVKVRPDRRGRLYSRVSLTEAGWEEVANTEAKP